MIYNGKCCVYTKNYVLESKILNKKSSLNPMMKIFQVSGRHSGKRYGAYWQNTQEVKLKHRKARCLVYYLQGDTSKEAQSNDQTTNRIVANFFRNGVGR